MKTVHFQVKPDGKLTDGARQVCANIIAGYAGKIIQISIGEKKEKRSLDQNSYYRGVILPHVRAVMFEEGDARSADDWHEALLDSFSPLVEIKGLDGKIKMAPKRTHNMEMPEMAEFITAITAEFATRGYPVPIME